MALKSDRSSCLLYYLAIAQAEKGCNRFFIKVGDDFFLNIMYCWEALNVMVSFLGVTGNAA